MYEKRTRIGEKKALTSRRFFNFRKVSFVAKHSGKLIKFIYPFSSTGAGDI